MTENMSRDKYIIDRRRDKTSNAGGSSEYGQDSGNEYGERGVSTISG